MTACSPHHFDLVRCYGADHVFDYHDHDIVEQVKRAVSDLRYVFDTIGNETSSVTASQAISEHGGTLCTVRPGKDFTKDVSPQTRVKDVLVWTAFLKDHQYKEFHYPVRTNSPLYSLCVITNDDKANEDDHKLAGLFCEKLPEYIESGVLKPNKPKVYSGGLDDVPKGFQEYRDGKISGYKIVYQL